MRRIGVLLVALAATASLAAGASAAKVAWNESAKNGKVAVMRFHVDSFTFGKNTWSAHVSIANVSKKTIRVGNRFGAAIFDNSKTENLDQEIGLAVALSFSPARPTVLKPGATWTGTISGQGRLQPSASTRWARLVLGPLSGLPGQSRAVWWVTDHALTLAPTAPGGTVI